MKGRNLAEGVPRSFTLNSNEILQALQEPLESIVSAVRQALAQTPPDLGSDVAESGVMLTGGGALLRNMDKLITTQIGLPVLIADDPMTCVARGGCGRRMNLGGDSMSCRTQRTPRPSIEPRRRCASNSRAGK